MHKFILGRKLGMSQIFTESGEVVPVTVIEAGPAFVVQVKTKETDGYDAVQIGFGEKKKANKPLAGHVKKSQKPPAQFLREFRIKDAEFKIGEKELKLGETLDTSIFEKGDLVKISSISKAKGFQGGVKRHHFKGAPASHGHKHVLRRVGSIGQRFPQHTLKGTRMAGRMGGERVTVRGLKVADVNKDKNVMLVRGAVPGRKGALLEIVSIK